MYLYCNYYYESLNLVKSFVSTAEIHSLINFISRVKFANPVSISLYLTIAFSAPIVS